MKFWKLFLIVMFSCVSCNGTRSYTYLADGIFTNYAKEMKVKRNLVLLGTGGAMPRRDVKSLYMSFGCSEKLTLEQARKLYVELIEGLVIRTNNDTGIQPYLHDQPFTWKNIEIDLLCFTENTKFISEGYIAGVAKIDDDLCFRKYDAANDHLETFYREPYEEALRIVEQERNSNGPSFAKFR